MIAVAGHGTVLERLERLAEAYGLPERGEALLRMGLLEFAMRLADRRNRRETEAGGDPPERMAGED